MSRWFAVEASARQALLGNLGSNPSHSGGSNQNHFNSQHSPTGVRLRLASSHAWLEGKLQPGSAVGACRASYQPEFRREANNEESRRVVRSEENLQVGTWIKVCEVGQLTQAVEALGFLVQQGSYIDHSISYSLIKKCTQQKNLVLGQRVHALVVKYGYESNAFLANHIICMYASHARLEEAMEVFTKVPLPDSYMWTSIILAHARHGCAADAVLLYRRMRRSSVQPNSHVFVAALKACANGQDLSSGREIHSDIVGTTHEFSVFVGNCLVYMYSKCGSLQDARKVFDQLPTRDVVTWTSMIAGYAQHGLGNEALALYRSMQVECISPANNVTFVCLLQACASVGCLHEGRQLHAQIQERGLEADVVVGTCLVDMYSKCWNLQDARRVFDNLPRKNVVTWNAMIAGYTQHGLGHEALTLYGGMERAGNTAADSVTFLCLLQACTSMGALHEGEKLHAKILERGLQDDVGLANCLVNMYAKCGSLEVARNLFDNLPAKDVVTWNAMIAGYAEHGFGPEALSLYEEMQQEGITVADAVTFMCLLQACTTIGAWQQGKQLHQQIQQRGFEAEVVVGNCLIDMYAKCGSFEDARKVFNGMPLRDVVTWNAMIAGYAQHGLGAEALELYELMKEESKVAADAVTFVSLLQAYGSVAGLKQGKEVHVMVLKLGLLETDPFVASTLIDMYGKCGSMVDAQQVFDELAIRDVVTWNALIAGYAHHGESEAVFTLFQRMRQDGIQPNSVVALSLLTVCSHVGLVDKGQHYFQTLLCESSIAPTMEHYNCMVDLLGRAGHLHQAMEMVKSMPSEPCCTVWRSLLGACRKWRTVEIGRLAFSNAVKLDKNDAAAYVLMSNIFAAADMQEEARQIQSMRVKARAWKKAGQSWWTDIDGIVHTFVVGDREHCASKQIHAKLGGLFVRMEEEE